MDGVIFEKGKYGPCAVITAPWQEEMANALTKAGVLELELNDGKGWRGTHLYFLTLLPRLRSLKIIDLRIRSVSEIHSLNELRELELITYCDSEVRFSAFPVLERCVLHWRAKAKSLFECLTLKDLFIDGYDGTDTTPFSKLGNLQSLAIMNAPIETLEGLSKLKKLQTLRLGRLVCLTSLSGIEETNTLQELELQRCRRIGSVKQIAGLVNLRRLHLNDCGEIESLKPLANLKHLQSVLFYESTNILDGDLAPLTQLPHLSQISFKNRRHYSHRREDFGTLFNRVKP